MLASFLAGDGNPDEQTGDMPVSIRALLTLILPLPLLLLLSETANIQALGTAAVISQ
jgi:hypothetical protein